MSDQPDTEHRWLRAAVNAVKSFRAVQGDVTDPSELVSFAEDLIHVAAEAVYAAEECVRAAEKAPAVDLVALLEFGVPEVSGNVSSLRTALEGISHDALQAEGEVDAPWRGEGSRAYATFAKEKVQTDGLRLLGVLVARAADEAVDRETGEVLTPTEMATRTAAKIAACSGVTNNSHRWRKGECAKEGIDLAAFTSSEQGAKKVGFTAPHAVRAPIQRGEDAA